MAGLVGHLDEIVTLCFSEDGAYLATGSKDKNVRLWCGFTGDTLHVLEGHQDSVEAFSSFFLRADSH